jgi:hypothetical protein
VNISGATSSTYTLQQADVGKAITVVATYTDAHGPSKTVTSAATGAVAALGDAPGTIAAIGGTATQGQVLTAGAITDADGGVTGTTWQWKADGVNISGATSSTYTLQQADVGKAITVVATYTDAHGPSKTVTSAATAAVTDLITPSIMTTDVIYTAGNHGAQTLVTEALKVSDYYKPLEIQFSETIQKGASGNVSLIDAKTGNTLEIFSITSNKVSISGDTLTLQMDTPMMNGSYQIKFDNGAVEDVAHNSNEYIFNNVVSNLAGLSARDLTYTFIDAKDVNSETQAQSLSTYEDFTKLTGILKPLTDASGVVGGSNALTSYISAVTGTDIVSQTEYQSGFSINGKIANAFAKFYLDNDRVNNLEENGIDLTGQNGVQIVLNADNTFSLSFSQNSALIKQGTYNTPSSGVHKLSVDVDGDGDIDTSRLFYVAPGVASLDDVPSVNNNYTTMDVATKQIFVYYSADIDNSGVGYWELGNADTDARSLSGMGGNFNYTKTAISANAIQQSDLALPTLFNAPTKIYEFHIAKNLESSDYAAALVNAGNHSVHNSNTSRLINAEEAFALYAANFGADLGAGSQTVGAIQAIDHTTTGGGLISQNNTPASAFSTTWVYNQGMALLSNNYDFNQSVMLYDGAALVEMPGYQNFGSYVVL